LNLKGSRVLVTGGAGFIGSHLVDRLSKLGCSIIILDNMSGGRLGNIRNPLSQGYVKLVRGDITRARTAMNVVNDVDYVFHTAAIVASRSSTTDDSAMHETNVTGTLNLLIASNEASVKRFLYLSSAAVYGEPNSLPVSEGNRTSPISFYGMSKLVGEHYCRLFNSLYGLRTVSLRLFNVYGPRQSHGPYAGVITSFVDRLLRGKRPIIYGDGLQTRDFVHVSDVAHAMISAAKCNGDVDGRVFNIGSGRAINIMSLARKLADLCDRKGLTPIYKHPVRGDIRRSRADLRRAIKSLGFRCMVSLDEGLIDYVATKR